MWRWAMRLVLVVWGGVALSLLLVRGIGALRSGDDMLFYLMKTAQPRPAEIALRDLGVGVVISLTPGENILSYVAMPDGKHLLYIKQMSGAHAFYRLNLYSRDSQFLMADPTLAITPTFSADGTEMVYDNFSTRTVYRVDMTTMRSERLLYYGGPSLAFPDWSPDGPVIVMAAPHPDTTHTDLLLYDLRDESRTWLTNDTPQESHPRFSPDGQALVYRRIDGARHSIVVHDLQTNTTEVIYDALYDLWGPDWSPDGETVAFQVIRAGRSQVVRVDLASGELVPVTAMSGWYSNPMWRPPS